MVGRHSLTAVFITSGSLTVDTQRQHFPSGWTQARPMGIEVDAVNVGVFPEVVDVCPPELRRPLELFNERFVNYASLEDSPHGQ